MKVCKNCNNKKEFKCFYKHSKMKDGYVNVCKSCTREKYLQNKGNILSRQKVYKLKNKVVLDKYHSDYREQNKLIISDRNKKYSNRTSSKLKRNKRLRDRRKNDHIYRLKRNLCDSITRSFKNHIKNNKTSEILGCSFQEFRNHIESQFEPWMNWGNYGNPKDGILEPLKTWDLDHITPISSAKTKEQIIKLNHFSNFQPLCSKVNRFVKRDKI